MFFVLFEVSKIETSYRTGILVVSEIPSHIQPFVHPLRSLQIYEA